MNRLPEVSAASESTSVLSESYQKSQRLVGYVPRSQADADTYAGLGFKSGLEIHQQLLTDKKLFCHCPAGVYQHDAYDAEVIRHMRPTLSEMGEYDGTALMEKRTRKTIVYRIKNETACTYDVDDTPPFKIDRQALDRALEIALMLGCSIVGELHITRKQYLDGSIPTGFQRTGIIGIEGEIPLANKKIRIIQLSLEEDSCREVSDIGHTRTYTTDRLGMPLIESVTYPEMLTPDECAEAAQYLRMLVRTSGKVRTGIGAGRQDVNVSIDGGTRVEIKGVSHILWIPELTHVEAFRQKALLTIRDELKRKIADQSAWKPVSKELTVDQFGSLPETVSADLQSDHKLVAVNLPGFKDMLSFFTQPGMCFANELADRLKVIACLERPNLIHGEASNWFDAADSDKLRASLGAGDGDAQLLFWGPEDDMATALETIEERCRMAFEGIPNETRKALSDGTTIFERVLPGPDRMYPDTDSAPIPVPNEHIEGIRGRLVQALPDWLNKLREWKVPADTHHYLIMNKLVPQVEEIASETEWPERFIALLFGHTFKGLTRRQGSPPHIDERSVTGLCRQVRRLGFDRRLVREALSALYVDPELTVETAVSSIAPGTLSLDEAVNQVSRLVEQYEKSRTSKLPQARIRWVMGQLRPQTQGAVDPAELYVRVEKELENV